MGNSNLQPAAKPHPINTIQDFEGTGTFLLFCSPKPWAAGGSGAKFEISYHGGTAMTEESLVALQGVAQMYWKETSLCETET